MAKPRINPTVLLSSIDGGYIAYDPSSDQLHNLNPTAALLSELCNGDREIEDIRGLAGPLMPEGEIHEIDKWIDQGLKAGLLVLADRDSADRHEFSAPELYKIAKRLQESGQVQAAYLCEKRVVELSPNDWDAWYDLGEIAQCVGRRDEARAAYQKYFDNRPDDAEIEHLLMALRDDSPPPRASDRTIQHIYKSFAASYESRMLEDLKYVGPQRVQDSIRFVLGDRSGLRILDLGCGSGLAGTSVKDRASYLAGVDLSPEMIELARARGIYDQLEVAEITAWLDHGETLFDLIVCCDCLIYFGDLSRIVRSVGGRLMKGGFFAMTLEAGDRYPFHLTDTGRYTHHADHVREVAGQSGFRLTRLDQSFLRMEYGEEVMGLFALLEK